MFNRIARRYDLLNRLLSARRDVVWRKKCVRLLPDAPLTVLDLATGTADMISTLLRERPNIRQVIGIDPAVDMLKIGRRKLNGAAALLNGDAQQLAVRNESLDAITIAFGIRNVPDVDKALAEMYRALKTGGQLLILEFSLPRNRFVKTFYLLYFRHVLPFIGGVISGDRQAYQYLNATVEDFPYGKKFCRRLEQAGFVEVRERPLTFGIATIYSAKK